MTAEDIHCPICRMPAKKSTVGDRLDYVIECPRCKAFQIDRRAFINLDRGSDASNAAVLSGIARLQYDSCGEIPRLSWIRLEDDRDGRYEFDGTESLRLSASDKCRRLLEYIGEATAWTPGETIVVGLPEDLSLAYARSEAEFDSYVRHLGSDRLIECEKDASGKLNIALTIKGADRPSAASIPTIAGRESELRSLAVTIQGEKIGSGAYGEVYLGTQHPMERLVAVKLIQPEAIPDAIDHAIGLAKVSHPNVVQVYDVGLVQMEEQEDPRECVVMQWIEGDSICDVWGVFSPEQLIMIGKQLIAAVEACHASGICHHDLHAGNVMLSRDHVYLIDVQYTESARFSRVSTQATERLIRDDWSAVARIIRNAAWSSQLISFPAELEQLCVSAQSKSDIRKLLEKLEVSSDRPGVKNEAADDTSKGIASFFSELEDFDLRVFKTACELLLQQERYQSLISVPGIARELEMDNDPAGDVGAAIRLLVELNYLQGTDPSNSRFVFVHHPAFRRYLEGYVSTYSRDFQRAKVAIVNGEADCDASLAAWLELPRPLAEHFLVDLGESRLISIQGYNTGVNVTGISERLRRQVLEFGD